MELLTLVKYPFLNFMRMDNFIHLQDGTTLTSIMHTIYVMFQKTETDNCQLSSVKLSTHQLTNLKTFKCHRKLLITDNITSNITILLNVHLVFKS